MRSWALIALLLSGCIQDHLVPCGEKLCPVGSLCVQDTCVQQGQLDVCMNQPDGTDCHVLDLPPGRCYGGVCHVPNCGDGFVDAPVEQCDDGNHVSGDGCSADCLSNEMCGNDEIDAVTGEQCDGGIAGLSGDGCTSTCRAEFELWTDVTPSQLTSRRRFKMVYDEAHQQLVGFGGYSNGTPLGDTWIFENGKWSQRFPPSSPEPRFGHAMTYDRDRGRVVLFGGTDGIVYHQSIWEWDGTAWTKRTFATAPAARINAAMIFDPDRHHIVMYGGATINGYTNETWTFDGNAWTPHGTLALTPGTYAPPAPAYTTLYYDAVDHQVLLLAAHPGDNQPLIYTWLPEGNQGWDNPLAGPSGAGYQSPAIATPASGHPLWFGGRFAGAAPTINNTTYEWSNGVWSPVTLGATAPLARYEAAGGVDETGRMIVFGGVSSTGAEVRETWAWVATPVPPMWSFVPTTPLPSPRYGATAAFAPDSGEAAIFGGNAGAGSVAETWLWNEPSWASGSGNGQPREHAASAYDEDRDAMVVYGGVGCGSGSGSGSGTGSGSGSGSGAGSDCSGSASTYHDETYVLRHRTWNAPVVATRPPARASAAMTFDPAHHAVVLFGGNNASSLYHDTWAWNGSAWSSLSPSTVPPAMTAARMVYDRAHSTIVMYGGTGALGSVWLFDGAAWIDVTPATGPQPRNRPVFAYDPRRQRAVLHGGVLDNGQYLDDTWEWDTGTLSWTQRQPVQAPPVRQDAAFVYDALAGHIMMFGGIGPGGELLDDVWVYGFASTAPREACDGGDADHDGLVGCADPDCWARCTPHCPPGATCDPNASHCGDGACTPVESHALCPADCP